MATAIIGFVLLLQGNYYLGTTILGILAVVIVLFLCVYVAFAKTPPLVEGGRGVYRFEKYRPWAFAGIGLMVVIGCAVLLFEQSRLFVIGAFVGTSRPTATLPAAMMWEAPTGTATIAPVETPTATLNRTPMATDTPPFTPALTQVPTHIPNQISNPTLNISDCSISLGIATTPTAPISDDEAQIRHLIKTEAEAVLDQNTAKVISIFRGDTVIRSAGGYEWKGCGDIKRRYDLLFEMYTFTLLKHEVVELKITGDIATAKTVVEAEYVRRDPFDEYKAHVTGLYLQLSQDETGESWRFKKENGIWKVTLFIYGLSP